MKYILDFDRTVFDMEGLYRKIKQVNPGCELGSVESLIGINLEELLFKDAIEFFALCDPCDIEVVSSGFGLTGQWDTTYQRQKIAMSNVAQYVSAIHVVEDSKISTIKRLARELDDVVYVDDHPEHVADAVQHIPSIQTLHLDRSGSHLAIPGASTITKLTDIGATI